MTLIITTRSSQKSGDTIKLIHDHVNHHPRRKALFKSRISLQAEQLDLTHLRSVQDAAQSLLLSVPKIDVLILNAGIAGPQIINWPQAVWRTIIEPIDSVTYPTFTRGHIGTVTKSQLPTNDKASENISEPPLGEIFCANVFGHYILTHNLVPLLSRATLNARIICLSSIEAQANAFSVSDIQALSMDRAYHSSKRLTDLLALTSTLPATQTYVNRFFTAPNSSVPVSPRPRFYVAHPGVCSTNIIPLMTIMLYLKVLSFYIARWLGSPWHPISAYKGAYAAVWLALVSQTTIDEIEEQDGKAKWGSCTDVWGREGVMRTQVQGWGYGGKVGDTSHFDQRGRRDAKDLTAEEREEFEDLGREAWKQMEQLREEWEDRLR